MPEQKIKTKINCQNIALIESLTKEITSSSLKFGIFGNNGSGKTFISRMFRLTENSEELQLDEKGNSPTDKLIRLGQTEGVFKFKIEDKGTKEHFTITLNKQKIPKIPQTTYLFHVFNEDYVDENLRSLDYDKDNKIDGFILGKVNIDLSDDEEKLGKIKKDGIDLSAQIENEINTYIADKIDNIPYIKKFNEYQEFDFQKILKSVDKASYEIAKSYDELIEDYNKIKSVPENLEDIGEVNTIEIDLDTLTTIKESCTKEYSLSTLAEEFKKKIKSKQEFIETGIPLLDKKKNECPFCEQNLETDALNLIDNYNKYLSDVESRTIKLFNDYKTSLEKSISEIDAINTSNTKRINTFNTYKNTYIPSSSDVDLKELTFDNLTSEVQKIIKKIDLKLADISKSIIIEKNILESIKKHKTIFNGEIESNNKQIQQINKKKNRISGESLSIRRQLCKRTLDDLIDKHKPDIKKLEKLRKKYSDLKAEIERKKRKGKD